MPNLLRSRNCFLALSYSILEATRQCSDGGCTALADAERSVKIVETTANNLAAAMLFLSRPPFIASSPPEARYIRPSKLQTIGTVNVRRKTIAAAAACRRLKASRRPCPDLSRSGNAALDADLHASFQNSEAMLVPMHKDSHCGANHA